MNKCALRLLLAAACFVAMFGAQSPAHPHVWASMRSELVYSSDGQLVAIRHAWSFGPMFSALATQDVRAKQRGVFTREELQPTASLNVASLKEFGYFTSARVDDEAARLGDAADYWLEYANSVLTLHFALPLRTPVKPRTVEIELRDPTFVVDLAFAENEPVLLANAPNGCKLTVLRPRDTPGIQGSNRISVSCP